MSRGQPPSDKQTTGDPASSEHSIAVVGGGIIGLAIAWSLVNRGYRITILEKGTFAAEASWAGAGMLAPGGELAEPSRLASLCCQSRALYPAWIRGLESASGSPIEYQECGGLTLAYSQSELDQVRTRAVCQEEMGIHSRPISGASIHAFWPYVGTQNLAGGRFYPDDAVVNPRDLTAALTCVLRPRADLIEHLTVRHVSLHERSVGVETEHGSYSFDAAVISAGAWSGSISVDGAPPLPPSEPVKGHLIAYRQPEQTCGTIVRHGHTYLLQRANGQLIVGASVEHVGFNRDIDQDRVAELARGAEFILPHLSETTPSEIWTGFRPGSDDLHIGPWHSSRLHLAYGHFRNGILLAPVTAQLISAEISASLQML